MRKGAQMAIGGQIVGRFLIARSISAPRRLGSIAPSFRMVIISPRAAEKQQDKPSIAIMAFANLSGDPEILIKKAYAGLPPSRAFIIYDTIVDDARGQNAFALVMSLNMLIETAGRSRLHGRRMLGLDASGRSSRVRDLSTLWARRA